MKVTKQMVQTANCRLMGLIDPRPTEGSKLFDRVRAMPRMTADQVFEQKVSWCFGQLGQDSQLTKDDVRRVLLAQSGFKDRP